MLKMQNPPSVNSAGAVPYYTGGVGQGGVRVDGSIYESIKT